MRESIVALSIVFLLTGGAGRAAEPVLCRNTDFINARFVPTADIAKKIYIAVGEGINANFLKKYPIVGAEDEGDHWSLWQSNDDPMPKAGPNEVIVSAGGGQLLMNIDKCSGAVSDAHFNR